MPHRFVLYLAAVFFAILSTTTAQDDNNGILELVLVPDVLPGQLDDNLATLVTEQLNEILQDAQQDGYVSAFELTTAENHRIELSLAIEDANDIPLFLLNITDEVEVDIASHSDGQGLLEFVNLTDQPPAQIAEGVCIITTAQVASVPELSTFECPPLEPDSDPSPAISWAEDTPFTSIVTHMDMVSIEARKGRDWDDWGLEFAIDPANPQIEAFTDFVESNPGTMIGLVFRGRLVAGPFRNSPYMAGEMRQNSSFVLFPLNERWVRQIACELGTTCPLAFRLRIERMRFGV